MACERNKKYHRENSLTDLHDAVLTKCKTKVENIIENNDLIDLVDHHEQSALFYASERGFVEIVEILLKHGANHCISDGKQKSCLWIAAKEGHRDVVHLLLRNGADPNKRAHDGTTALYQASYFGHVEIVYYLIQYGASVDITKNSGASPLFVAARNGHHRIVKHLLKHDADSLKTQEDLRSPLHAASLYNRVKCIRLLFQNKFDHLIEQTDIYGWNTFHFLAKKGNMKATRTIFHYLRILGKSINYEQADYFGNTPLHIAVLNRNIKFAAYLIKMGFRVNQPNVFNWTYDSLSMRLANKKFPDETLPKFYLNSLLSIYSISHTREEETMRDEIERFIKELIVHVGKLDPLFCNCIIGSGSYYEGTRVGLPDEFDFMINLTEIERLSIFSEGENDPPGYGRLYRKSIDEAREKLEWYIEPVTQCLSAEKIRKRFYDLLTTARGHVFRKENLSKFKHLKFQWTSNDKRCGTTINVEWYGEKYPFLQIQIDVVPCLTVFAWPTRAAVQCPFDKEKFHIIPRSPRPEETYLWRISTSSAELKFFQSLTADHKNGYLVLKCLRLLNPFNCKVGNETYTESDLITSYMFKNEVFYAFYRYPQQEKWMKGALAHRILFILKRLHNDLLIGKINSFSIKDYNVIDTDDYKKLRQFEIQYCRQLIIYLKDKLNIADSKLRRAHTFLINQPTNQRKLLRQRAVTFDPL